MNKMTSIRILIISSTLFLSSCGLIDGRERNSREMDVFVEEHLLYSKPALGNYHLYLTNISGAVRLIGTEDTDSIIVRVTKRVGAYSPAEALDGLGEINPIFWSTNDEMHIETRQPSDTDERVYEVDYLIQMPSDATVFVDQISGAVTVSTMSGTIEIEIISGLAVLESFLGNAVVEVNSGIIQGGVSLPDGGYLNLSVLSGLITLDLPGETSANLSANVVSGNIVQSGLNFEGRTQTPTTFSGRLGEGHGQIDLSIVSGKILISGSDSPLASSPSNQVGGQIR